MNKHILLIGMPGSGKSTIGKLVADKLKVPFIDTDRCIESELSLPLPQIVKNLDNADFLNLEAATILRTLSGNTPSVISPGGSIAYHQTLRQTIKKSALCFYLHVPIPDLQTRIGTTPRGIVGQAGSFDQLYVERAPLYTRLAHYKIDGNRAPNAVAAHICTIIKQALG